MKEARNEGDQGKQVNQKAQVNPGVPGAKASRYEMVDARPQITKREPEGATLWPSGFLKLNTAGSERWLLTVQERDLDPKAHASRFGVDVPAKVVAAFPVAPGTPLAAPVNVTGTTVKTVTMHLGGVFEKYPDLRVSGKRKVVVTSEPDDDGTPCIQINLQTERKTRTTARTSSGTDGTVTAASKKGAKSRKTKAAEAPAQAAAAPAQAEEPEKAE